MIRTEYDRKSRTLTVENIQICQEAGLVRMAAHVAKAKVEWVADETGWESKAIVHLTKENEETFWEKFEERLAQYDGLEDLAIPRYAVCKG